MLPAAQEFLSRASRALEATDSRRRLLDAKPRSCNSDVRQILEEEHSRWTEAARVFQRFNQEEEIPLISSTVDDMYCYLFRLCDGLLDYVREFVTGSEQGGQQKDLLQRVTLLFEGGIFHFFTVLCSKKKCASLLGGDEVKGVDLQSHVFELLIGQKHFVWMASVFTAFCDEARRACAGEASVRASSATAVRASLECLLLCSEESILCARALMFTEPRPLVGHLLYGLRLRVATKSLMYTQATLGDAVVSLPTSQSPHQQPAAADKTKVCCAEGELGRMGNRQLAEYLLKIRRSVFSEVNLLALSVAVHVMKNASGYESPAVVTALCFIIELSGHALIPQMCGESKVPLPLSVKIAMYENILSAWSALLWCLRAASSDISQPDSAAKCNAVLQEQLKHNLAECLALLLEHCQVILCSESCLLNLITLQCAPTLLHGASAMECGTVWTHYPPTVVMQSSRFPTEFDECGGSGLPLLDPPVICKQTNDDWWYDSVVFVKVAKGLVTVMCEALGRDTESYSIRPMILGLLSRVSLNSSAAFNGLGGHCVIRLILTELRKADVQLPVSTFRQDERVAMRGDGGAGGESVVSGASLSGIVPGNGYTQERCAATSGSDSDAPNTCAHFLVGYLWRAYGELRIRPLSAEIIELIELPLLLVQWLKLVTLGCSISHTLAFLFTTVVTLWRIGLTHDEEGQFFMRSKEVLLELLATLEEVDGMMNSIVCMTTASGADADTVVSDSCGDRDTMIHLIPISDKCWTSSADVTSAVGGDAVALISGMLDFHLQQDARFVRIEELRLFLGFFLSTDASLHELGRACITCTLQYDVVYGAYFELLDEMESSTLQRFLPYLAPDGQQSERQTWLFKKGCVTAVVTALQRVLSTPSCVDDFPTFTRQVFFFLSAVEPSHSCGPQLATTQLVHAVTYSLPSLGDNVAHFIALAQAVLNAAVSGNRQDGENAPDRPTSGPFTMRCHDFVVKKPFFLSLLPPLLQRAHEMGIHMWEDLVSTIQLLLRSTGRIRSETLLHWAVQTRHTSLLPYLELEPATAEQMLPFIETRSGELKSFWTPVLLEAPERSEVRFGSTGGIVITVKQWPTQGFTISSHFRLDKVGSCVELFELVGSDGTASTSVAVCLVDGSSLYVQTNGKPVLIGEFHSFSGLVLQQWAQFHIVMSVTHTASVYLNATKIGSCSLRYFRPRSEVKIHVGFVNRVIPGALLSLGAVVLWDEELTTPQVEAHVAGESTPANPSKLLPCQVPRVVSKSREAVPLDDRVASFVPYEHSGSGMLMNSLSYITEERCPISANLTGGYAKPPRSWVDYRSLFVNRGGLVYLLHWVGESTSAEELQRYMEVACNCIRSISSASTLDYRTYVLLNHQLRRVSHLITHEVCDTLIHLAVVQVPALEAVHTVIINRYVFLHVFRDTELLTIMPLECALYLVNRIEHMFSAAPNRIVQHNVEIISSLQFVDSVLNSLAYANTRLAFLLLGRLIACLKQIMVASGYDINIVNAFVSTAAVLTPVESQSESGCGRLKEKHYHKQKNNSHVRLPQARFPEIRASSKFASDVVLLIMRSLVECCVDTAAGSEAYGSPFSETLGKVINLSWFVVCTSRFAYTPCVVYATRLLFEAAQWNSSLRAEITTQPFTVVEALAKHASSEDLIFLLMSVAFGAARRVELLSPEQPLPTQLEMVMNPMPSALNAVAAPIFSKLLMLHLNLRLFGLRYPFTCSMACLMQRRICRSFRLYKYFNLAFVTARLMLVINVRRVLGSSPGFTPVGPPTEPQCGAISAHSAPNPSSSFANDQGTDGTFPLGGRWRVFRSRAAFISLKFCITVWSGVRIRRYGRLLQISGDPTASTLLPSCSAEGGGACFALNALQQLSQKSALFFDLTRSPYQIALLAMFASLPPEASALNSSRELYLGEWSVSSELKRSVESISPSLHTPPVSEAEAEGGMDGTMGSGAESDDGASFDSESIDAESEKSVKNEGKCSATTTSTYSSTHVAEDAPHFVMQSLESLALANSEASETVQDTSKSLLQEESRDHGRVAVLKDGFDILDLAPNKSISHESIPATENGKHLSAYNADREDQSNRQGYLSSLGRGASARNYGALKKSAARVLHNIIAASVQAPPIPPHSPHTQLYGPCGGLLFQLMFLRGSIKDAEERAATLVRLFAQQIMKHAILARDPLLSEEEVSPRARKAAHNLKGELSVAQWSSGMGHLLFHPAGSSPTHSRENQSNDRAESSVQSANGVIFHNLHGFNNLLVDLLTLKMIKLGNIVPYFAKLLSHATLTWPKPPLEELRVQVANICIVSLSKPSAERVTTGEMTLVHLLLSKALSPPWPMKKMLDYLVSALLRVYTNQPWPVTSEVAEGQRRELAARCLRVVMRAHDGREELKKALSLNTVTQRTSLCKGIAAALLMKEETDALIAFEAYCSSNAPLLQALISGRLKAKTEHALKLLLKKRNEFVQHIKKLNEEFRCGTQPKDKHHTAVLAQSFTAGFTSRVGSIALLEPTRWHWLTLSCCSLEHDDARLRTLYYVDARRNRSKVVVRDTRFISDNGALHTGEQHRRVASTRTATSGAGTSCQSVSLMNAGHCEQQASHMSTLLPPFPLRCRPYIIHGTVPFIDSRIEVTPSAVTLLQYLLQPREVLRFICNGFHVYGINVTPCLILLTDSALKVFGFSHVTEEGDIVICDKEDGSGGEGQSQEIKPPFVTTEDKCGLEEGEKQGHRHFNNLAHHVTKKLRRFLAEGVGGGGGGRKYREKEAHKDGTRVAQSVKHASGQSYKDLYWVYPVRNISGMRLAQYMHQDTAIILELMYDDGPMLSIVDSKQSMNTRVRDAFIGTLQDVLGTRRCVFQDHYKMHSLMRHTLACWVAGSMSTFDYLTVLNRAAGRTVLDYNQYPVFPWVIADYRSDTLVLESESSYRDLSMPMGAQTEARRQAVGQMFSQMVEIQQQEEDVKGLEDVGGESEKTLCRTWPFHHGTHYSTGGGVLHYLIRVEPFTTFARIFQGGELDVAARLFDSVEGSYQSCINGPADCKELTPEFYTDGQFLINVNHCDFGEKSDGTAVDDVKLPPWAKNSAQVFTAVMRYVLESDAVSRNIHRWIDLIFGVRRRGQLAEECYNVFQRMTYGEEVLKALRNTQDPHDVDVIIAEVENFGQTPVQLFRDCHPAQNETAPTRTAPNDQKHFGIINHYVASGSGTANANWSNNNSIASISSSNASSGMSAVVGAGVGARRPYTLGPHTSASSALAPRVRLMLKSVLGRAQQPISLRDPPAGSFLVLPENLLGVFRAFLGPVTDFATTRSGQFAQCFRYLAPVDDEDYTIGFVQGEDTLMRFDNTSGALLSSLKFLSVPESSVNVSATRVSCRETLVVIGSITGAIYCLKPSLETGALVLSATLCHHTNSIAGFALDTDFGRMVSFTVSVDDFPIVWCVQQLRIVMLHRLDMGKAVSQSATACERRVVSATVDSLSANSVIATTRYVAIFDRSGEICGAGGLPQPTSNSDAIEATAQHPSTSAEVVNRMAPRIANISCVTVYSTPEWAGGTQLLLTGHEDGSLSLWSATRLPPHETAHGCTMDIKHHGFISEGSNRMGTGAVTAIRQPQQGVPSFLVGFQSGSVKVLSFDQLGN